MKRFQSPAHRVHRIREQQQRLSQITVSAASAELATATAQHGDCLRELTMQSNETSSLFARGIFGDVLHLQRLTRDRIEQQSAQATQAVRTCEAKRDAALSEYIVTQRNTELVERLVKRQQEEHRRKSILKDETERFERHSATASLEPEFRQKSEVTQ